MTIDERLDRLTEVVKSLAASVVHHDDQIDKLVMVGQKHQEQLDRDWAEILDLRRATAEAIRVFQAYLNRLPPQ